MKRKSNKKYPSGTVMCSLSLSVCRGCSEQAQLNCSAKYIHKEQEIKRGPERKRREPEERDDKR